jgi:hypothetical protein
MEMWCEIEAARERWDVGRHPLHMGWSAAAPRADEMSVYAAGYREAVRALGDGAARLGRRRAIDDEGRLRAAAEREWALADVWGELQLGSEGAGLAREIEECAAVWSGAETQDPLVGLVILQTVDRARAELAPRLAAALPEDHPARSCLWAEAELSLAHADLTRELAGRQVPAAGVANLGELLSHVEAACSVHWDLLDAIEAVAARGALAHA